METGWLLRGTIDRDWWHDEAGQAMLCHTELRKLAWLPRRGRIRVVATRRGGKDHARFRLELGPYVVLGRERATYAITYRLYDWLVKAKRAGLTHLYIEVE